MRCIWFAVTHSGGVLWLGLVPGPEHFQLSSTLWKGCGFSGARPDDWPRAPKPPGTRRGCQPARSHICEWRTRDPRNPDTTVVSPLLGEKQGLALPLGNQPPTPLIRPCFAIRWSLISPPPPLPPLQRKGVLASLGARLTHTHTLL